MTEIEIQAFHDSFSRCMAHSRFFDLFYEDFLGSSYEVKEKFEQTNFTRQKRALRLSLILVMNAVVRKANDFSCLKSTAIRHSRSEVDIQPHLYTLWLNALLRTVKKCDGQYHAQTEKVWRDAFEPAIDYIISKY